MGRMRSGCSESATRWRVAPRIGVVLMVLSAAWVAPVAAGDEDALRAEWQGAWVVLGPEVASNCDGRYTNNDVHGAFVRDQGARRFAAGELGRVANVQLKKRRVDLLVDLTEPALLPMLDGPFTLLREAVCQVELRVDLTAGGSARVAEANRLFAGLAARFPSQAEAEASANWNGRRREDYPDDYEDTLAEYEVWKASQVNTDVAASIDLALDEAGRIAARADTDAEYAVGFMEGLEVMTDAHWGGCPELLASTFYGKKESPPRGQSDEWEDGFKDGQRLGYNLELARRLQRCFVPVPER